MIKLLYITNGITGSGGLERVLSVKASLLADDYGYDVTILTLNECDKEPFYRFSKKIKRYDIEITSNGLKYISDYKKIIKEAITKIQPSIVSVCDDGLKGFFIPVLTSSKAKIIYERHVSKLIEVNENDSILRKLLVKVKWALMDRLAKNFDKFIVLTENNKKEWNSLKNIIVIPNPLPFKSEIKSSWQNKTVICVGKISYQKGQDLLIKAWELVYQHYPDWSLHLYGKSNLDFINTNALSNNVSYYPPEVNILEKYSTASVYVMPSRFEGFGMVLIEAMEVGLPCVSFNCDFGPSDIIQDGVDGYLVEKENIIELAEKIMLLIGDFDLRKAMGIKAKENVKRFSPEEITRQWHSLFKTILK